MTRILDPAGCRSGLDPATEQCVAVSSSETVCYGDSGGPALTTTAGGWWRLAGVTSRFDRGSTCGQSNAIYTDATAYTGWISDIIARNTR